MPTQCTAVGTIDQGDALCVVGFDGGNSQPEVARASAANLATSKTVFGVARAAPDGFGFLQVNVAGEVSEDAITSLGAGTSRIVATDINQAAAADQCKLIRIDRPDGSEHVVGTCDENGNLAVIPRASRETSNRMVFNVKAYGAVGDGVADDTAAINRAIAAANAAGGGVVFVPFGRFKVTTPTFTITAASSGTPIEITTATAHGMSDGDFVYVRDVTGCTRANGAWHVTRVSATAFTLNSSEGNGTYAGGGTATATQHLRPLGESVWLEGEARTASSNLPCSVIESYIERGFVVSLGYFVAWNVADDDYTYYNWTQSNGIRHLTFQNKLDQDYPTRPDVLLDGNAAIELTGATECVLDDVKVLDYPIGVVLDGAESVRISALFTGAIGPVWGDYTTDSIGLWLTASDGNRRYGFDIDTAATGNISVHNSVIGGAWNVFMQGAYLVSFQDCNHAGGVYAFYFVGCNNIRIQGSGFESGGYTSAFIFFESAPLGLTIADSFVASDVVPAIDCNNKTVGRLVLLNNLFGGGTEDAPYPIVNATAVASAVSFNNFANADKLFDNDIAGTYAFCQDTLAGASSVGLGVNRLNGAQALVDALITVEGTPLFRVLGSDGVATTVPRFTHDNPTVRKHDVHFHAVSETLNSPEAGTRTISQLLELPYTGAATNVAVYAIPTRATAVLEVDVLQAISTHATLGDAAPDHYARWRFSAVASKDLGDVIRIDPVDAAPVVAAPTSVIAGASGTPIRITTTADHRLFTGDVVVVAGVTGNTNANGMWTVTYVDATNVDLDGSATNAAYTGGGTATLTGFTAPVLVDDGAGNVAVRVSAHATQTTTTQVKLALTITTR